MTEQLAEQKKVKIGEGRILVSGQWFDKTDVQYRGKPEYDYMDEPWYIVELIERDIRESRVSLCQAVSDEEYLEATEKWMSARVALALLRGERDIVERIWGKPVNIKKEMIDFNF